jgi:hypothetical protein
LEWTAVKGELLHHNQHSSRTLLHPDVKVRLALDKRMSWDVLGRFLARGGFISACIPLLIKEI